MDNGGVRARLPQWKHVPISKKNASEHPCGLPYLLGLWIIRMIRQGYYRFEFHEDKEHIIIRALRSKKMKVLKEVEENG